MVLHCGHIAHDSTYGFCCFSRKQLYTIARTRPPDVRNGRTFSVSESETVVIVPGRHVTSSLAFYSLSQLSHRLNVLTPRSLSHMLAEGIHREAIFDIFLPTLAKRQDRLNCVYKGA